MRLLNAIGAICGLGLWLSILGTTSPQTAMADTEATPASGAENPAFLDASPMVQNFMAYAAFKMAQYDTARDMWLAIEGTGRPGALFNVARMYQDGLGSPPDLRRAIAYYTEAAEAGDRSSAYQLGLIHAQDHPELAKDPDKATYWLCQAALAGDTDARALLIVEGSHRSLEQLCAQVPMTRTSSSP